MSSEKVEGVLENFHPANPKGNPDAFKVRLENFAKEIVADIRKNEQMGDSLSFIFEYLAPELDEQVRKCIDSIWSRYELTQKARNLIELEETAQSKEPAWRPETGNYNIRPYKQYSLKKKLQCLQQRFAKDQEVIVELESLVVNLRENVEKVTEDMIKQMPSP